MTLKHSLSQSADSGGLGHGSARGRAHCGSDNISMDNSSSSDGVGNSFCKCLFIARINYITQWLKKENNTSANFHWVITTKYRCTLEQLRHVRLTTWIKYSALKVRDSANHPDNKYYEHVLRKLWQHRNKKIFESPLLYATTIVMRDDKYCCGRLPLITNSLIIID